MSNTSIRFDEELAENIELAAQVSSCIVLAGSRQHDRFLIGDTNGAPPRTLCLERICHERVNAVMTWAFNPARQSLVLAYSAEKTNLQTLLPTQKDVEKEITLIEALDAFSSLRSTDNAAARFALLVDAGLLLEDATAPHEKDFRLVQLIEHFARSTDRSRTLFLRVARTTSLPSAILSSPQARTVHIPMASRDVRYAYAHQYSSALAKNCAVAPAVVAQTLSDVTEDWTLDQLGALLETAERQSITTLHDLEELARAVRIGTTHSPWAGEQIRTAVANAHTELTKRVLDQSKAVDAVALALRKAVIGLSAAGSQTPRAVLFFSGPTGTGKTELAKSLSQLVYGQEQLLRFDCGELRQEHAVARLIGAPPGYVGYDRGGELTEGVRAKPNSVVLFDEIEKAHPRLLDVLLGVLDDGRLTSGQGETVFFGQTILIFTSNLGMYEEVHDGSVVTRRPSFSYDTPYEEIENKVRQAIRDEFITVLGRPELLGRLGGAESIIVFDYLRDLGRVCRKFVASISASCKRLHSIELNVDDQVIEQVVDMTRSSPNALILGGRGLRSVLDRVLTNPLSDYLFYNPHASGKLQASLEGERTVFSTG